MLTSGKVLLIGGKTSPGTDTATVDVFDPATSTMSAAAPMGTARNGHSATLLPNGKVLVAGGDVAPNGATLASAELYDPTKNTWAPAAATNQARAHHAGILMGNGKVFVTGGDGGLQTPIPSGSEVYDPGTNTWTAAQTFYGLRPYGPTATVLSDGRVLVYGGVEQVQPGNAAEFWDPATGQAGFDRFIGPSTAYSTTALLADGTVIIVGGEESYNPTGAVNTTTIFDPAKETCPGACQDSTWSAGPPMNVGHCEHTMTTLHSGLILVAGGRCGTSESIAVAEIYEQVGKKWWPAATMQQARGFHTAVLLPDGRVLVAGGTLIGGAITATTEIYTPA